MSYLKYQDRKSTYILAENTLDFCYRKVQKKFELSSQVQTVIFNASSGEKKKYLYKLLLQKRQDAPAPICQGQLF